MYGCDFRSAGDDDDGDVVDEEDEEDEDDKKPKTVKQNVTEWEHLNDNKVGWFSNVYVPHL